MTQSSPSPRPFSDAFLAALRPRPRITTSEWADRYRVIPQGTSPEHGRWRTDRTPYLREIMDACNDPRIDTVAVMMASQLGKTEAILNILGYFVDQDPSPILLVQPTIEAVEAFSKERIEPTFRASPTLRGKLEDGKDGRGSSRKSNQTIRLKQFPGGYLAMAGSNASSSLSSRPIRIVLCDEVDRFGETAGTEGDPILLAFQRTSNFEHNRKRILVSTPIFDGLSRIQQWYLHGDQRQYHVPCPRCGTMQVLFWEHLVYRGADGEPDLESIHYRCPHCGHRIEERHKPAMVADGQWIAQSPGAASGKIASFGDLSALYSPWVRWRTLVDEWIVANERRRAGEIKGLQEFINLRLGQPFEEGIVTITSESLEAHRMEYGDKLPSGIVLLTAGVDTQDNRLEAEVIGWGAGRESWGVQYSVLMGDPGTPPSPQLPSVWQLLDQLLGRIWETKDGRRLGVLCACVDSGGHFTTEVYDYAKAREGRRIFAIKGRGGLGVASYSKPSIVGRQRVHLFHVGIDDLKSATFARLLLKEPGPGYPHFPVEPERGYDRSYFLGLASEQRRITQKAGKLKIEWVNVRNRNEPLDCRVYASAALEILSVDLDALAARLAAGGGRAGAAAPAASAAPRARRRGMLSRGVG